MDKNTHHAAHVIREGLATDRNFDNCFEHAGAVYTVRALVEMADKEGGKLAENLPKYLARESIAAARAEAAAPELLDQLQQMTDAYAKAMKDAGVTRYPEALYVVRASRAAIAKATGEVSR